MKNVIHIVHVITMKRHLLMRMDRLSIKVNVYKTLHKIVVEKYYRETYNEGIPIFTIRSKTLTADKNLLNEFKELIENVSLEVVKEAQMKEVAKDVVTRSYKAEIADALEVISAEIERVKDKLQGLDYISEEEIKALVYGLEEKQEAEIKESEERVKAIVNQWTQELYIANEKLRTEVATVGEQVEVQMDNMNRVFQESMSVVGKSQRALQENVEVNQQTLMGKVQKLFWVNYGLMAVIIGLLIFIMTRGNYGG